MRPARIAALLACLSAPAAFAQDADFVACDGPLSDDDFYRLVACRAPPGKPCREDFVRWAPEAAQALRIGFAPVSSGYPAVLRDQLYYGLGLAIGSINRIGADLHLIAEDDPERQDITIHLISSREGEPISGTGNYEMDGFVIGAALVHISWDASKHITDATIAMAADIPLSNAYPVLLEEVTQSLGLMTDIRNPYYETTSVFSEDSNLVRKHGPQDRMAILRHYPHS
ncbi:hypothetical protein JQU17_11795 [Ponticoccus sp. SC2-23]|uniref:hypothetical protein n=1 Tax=Alexandriicola marinus TaxID=2081710 RepID=UPI000FD987C7|nr:hypothetical protein [Alexandriicola marinus]MBM1221578.1 hypothetical protein [Ponticoccus sp. SC6-9]MBM1226619.1 hypothetical protein [Ponticoccus sp. SC6-15]MBM1230570.1 hypothetical protein [Ponticoccus sp. SC6-38]MBM1235093.1 hypothetical protein [Ponticoccus sp. SC6-45]MBM1239591.1 hypothetical protein [Ponticoccus sp. SC6-49]MBM1243373.1 hypothetical protein [Ponticoccus sp. SC2-64]MBM1248617.1 hypothetical protein [Ponticoccus sp. SC6-42]MBM1253202.1 hypothetical protein [Pontico